MGGKNNPLIPPFVLLNKSSCGVSQKAFNPLLTFSTEEWRHRATRCWVWLRENRAKCVFDLTQEKQHRLLKKRFRTTLFKNVLKVSLLEVLHLFKITFVTVVSFCAASSPTQRWINSQLGFDSFLSSLISNVPTSLLTQDLDVHCSTWRIAISESMWGSNVITLITRE